MKKIILAAAAAVVLGSALFANGLKDAAAKYGFKMGAGISYTTSMDGEYLDILGEDFNSITATNEFKAYSLVSRTRSADSKDQMPVMDYSKADSMCMAADYMGAKIRGHVLVWDAYMPEWFFCEKYDPNNKHVDRKTMCKRLEYYINDVITHFETNFPGLIYCWDVVNEAVADSASEAAPDDACRIRKTRGGKPNYFYDVIGQDYVKLSFQYARKTLKKLNSDVKLFYNDYSTFQPGKKAAIMNLIKELNADEKLCDGMGMQGYIGGYGTQGGCMNPNDITLIEKAIKDYAGLGVEVQLTEMAVRNYRNDAETMKKHADFYESLFKMLKTINTADSKPLTAVSIWGLCDDPTLDKKSYGYKMNGPFCGVYDENFNRKSVYKSIMKALK